MLTQGLETTFYDVLGGATVALGTGLYASLRRRFQAYRFKQVFGNDADASSEHHIVYGMLHLMDVVYDAQGAAVTLPYKKPGSETRFNIEAPVSLADMRAASYLSEAFGQFSGISASLTADDELRDKLDVSYCSLGAFNNWKSLDVLNDSNNVFLSFNPPGKSGIVPRRDSVGAFIADHEYDYGAIVKICPASFPHRVWLTVAGIGEWGTSGAAWYLATHWPKIARRVGQRPFALIVRVRKERDESAEVVYSDFRPIPKNQTNTSML
jgi:hypothetical protein